MASGRAISNFTVKVNALSRSAPLPETVFLNYTP